MIKDNGKKFILRIIIIGCVIFIVNLFFFQIVFVDGISMVPTLNDKDIVVIKKINIKPERNDIVVIKKNKRTIVKRIIGKPGDIIKIDKFVYVNGQQFDEIETDDEENKHKEIILKNNQYFVLGDNRANSIDSRNKEIGIIQYKEILGKVIEKNGM